MAQIALRQSADDLKVSVRVDCQSDETVRLPCPADMHPYLSAVKDVRFQAHALCHLLIDVREKAKTSRFVREPVSHDCLRKKARGSQVKGLRLSVPSHADNKVLASP